LAAALTLVTLGASVWLFVLDRRDRLPGWLELNSDAPWGPLVVAFPDFTGAALYPVVLCVAVVCGVAVLWWRERRAAGEWRRAAAASRTSRALH
jgi:hypothetical protein